MHKHLRTALVMLAVLSGAVVIAASLMLERIEGIAHVSWEGTFFTPCSASLPDSLTEPLVSRFKHIDFAIRFSGLASTGPLHFAVEEINRNRMSRGASVAVEFIGFYSRKKGGIPTFIALYIIDVDHPDSCDCRLFPEVREWEDPREAE